jgi:hypothetical protein
MTKRCAILLVLLCSFFQILGQSRNQYLNIAEKCEEKGDYVCASVHYKTALAYDSLDLEVMYRYANSLRLSNEYKKSLYYFTKLYKKDGGREYPKAVFWLANLQKINGDYLESYKTWKRVKTIYRKGNSYENIKAKQEIKASAYARRSEKYRNEAIVTNLGSGINTRASEISPISFENKLMFASLRAKNMGENGEVYDELYSFKLYEAAYKDSSWQLNKELPMVINSPQYQAANGCFNTTSTLFYFTRCNSSNDCDLFVSNYDKGKWGDPKKLSISDPNFTETHPMSCEIEGEEYLFFVSDKKGGFGGMDIWYTKRNRVGEFESPTNAGEVINSPDNEITPFYDSETRTLYFSSDWHAGLGGFDIFQSKGTPIRFNRPQNLGAPINSRWNDLYYFIDSKNEINYLASNRADLSINKLSTCCNDLYSVTFPKKPEPQEIEITTLAELNDYLPVTLYFHNDRPNPRTNSKTTNLSYLSTYQDYISRIPTYEKEYSKGLTGVKQEEAILDIQDFFREYVEKGVEDLTLFTKLLLTELEKGNKIELTIKGFASPLAKTEYNVNLTERRIASLENYLTEFENGRFVPYLSRKAENGGELTIKRIPFGEYTASNLVSDNVNDQRNSVYSRAAALERKIEIQSVNYGGRTDSLPEITFSKEILELGKRKNGIPIQVEFDISNTGNAPLIVSRIEGSCSCTVVADSSFRLNPGESKTILAEINTEQLFGELSKTISVHSNAEPREKTVVILFEIIENK